MPATPTRCWRLMPVLQAWLCGTLLLVAACTSGAPPLASITNAISGGAPGDRLMQVVAMPDGGVVAAGYTTAHWRPGGVVRCIGPLGKVDQMVWRCNRHGQLLWCTVFGGSGDESSTSRARDILPLVDGSIILAGFSKSADFPYSDKRKATGISDGYVVRLSADGRRFVWATRIGGEGSEEISDVKMDARKHLVICGHTSSRRLPHARTFGPGVPDGFMDVMVASLDLQGRLDWMVLLGGKQNGDRGEWIVPMSTGDLVTGGTTWSPDFPVSPGAYRSGAVRQEDCYVARLAPDGTPRWVALVGGSEVDHLWYLGPGSQGAIWIAGTTGSADLPVTAGAAQPNHGDLPIRPFDAGNGFVAQLSPDGHRLLYCSYQNWPWRDRQPTIEAVVASQGGAGLAVALENDPWPLPWRGPAPPGCGVTLAGYDRYGRSLRAPNLAVGPITTALGVLPARDDSALVLVHPAASRIAMWRTWPGRSTRKVTEVGSEGLWGYAAAAFDGGRRIAVVGQCASARLRGSVVLGRPRQGIAAMATMSAPVGLLTPPGR